MSLGVLVRRFRDAFLHVLKHHGVDCPTLQAIRYLRSFGFGNQSGIAASREFVHGDEILAVCLRIAEHVPQLDLQRRGKPFAKLSLSYSRMTRIPLHDVVNVFLSFSPRSLISFGGSRGLQRRWVETISLCTFCFCPFVPK